MDEDAVKPFGTTEMMNKEDGSSPGGDSTGKAMASKSKEKKIPHYLRASTGSCHDLCKYGKRQIPVEKPWRSTTKKIFKKSLDGELNETLKPGSSKVKKVMDVKKKMVSDDSSEVIKREVVKHQVSGVSSGVKKPEVLIISSGDETPVKMKKKTTISSKLKPSPDLGSRSSGNVDALKPKVLTKSYSALATSKSKVNHEHVASPVLKPKMGNRSEGKDEDAKIKKVTVSSRVASKKVPVTPRASLSPRLSLRLAGNSSLRKSQSLKAGSSSSSRQNQKPKRVNHTDESNKQLDDYPVEEKTLHVVEMETTNNVVSENDQNPQGFVEPFLPPLPPTHSTPKDDECTVSETEEYEYTSGSNEAESEEEEIGLSNGEKKTRAARKEGDSADEAARKLRFRRGKIVDADTVGEKARKLKFRRGRDLGEDKAQDAQVRRSFKKREDIREEDVDEDGEKVVLRHQDVQEKDAQGLFNNVIEETASKLVEARKSKVKALVGAFETVISLQES
ncbi:Calmodulin-binding domain plant [Arabidopsis thaliana x Arabidopsis arenosa]|uniref:Calmodulin-binding domain plant n=1 Tax=Arabidopsis thaliana x Arabidopsis arenosa TaxID=1240361 RepID=A0A8T1YD63_9BRAS|nr:Calmodulin-binding domain plant [Arabidopsis thaliana x Arabidopsis arenosa]KAG7543874.1 Calmodulin-binding domain plant [Arabidopsis thaliana x Arabidopsis arenosa]KAG7543875.1 Calmodulin-binding domain plant [Arabidopsis thaliana x Arabidopsis arenosa]